MANKERGEVDFTVDNTTYTLSLGTYCAVELEGHPYTRGLSTDQVIAAVNRKRVRETVVLMWAALRRHHSDIANMMPDSMQKVCDLLDRIPPEDAQRVMAELIALNTDPGEQKATGAGVKRPRKARAGTGDGSTSKASRSA